MSRYIDGYAFEDIEELSTMVDHLEPYSSNYEEISYYNGIIEELEVNQLINEFNLGI